MFHKQNSKSIWAIHTLDILYFILIHIFAKTAEFRAKLYCYLSTLSSLAFNIPLGYLRIIGCICVEDNQKPKNIFLNQYKKFHFLQCYFFSLVQSMMVFFAIRTKYILFNDNCLEQFVLSSKYSQSCISLHFHMTNTQIQLK